MFLLHISGEARSFRSVGKGPPELPKGPGPPVLLRVQVPDNDISFSKR